MLIDTIVENARIRTLTPRGPPRPGWAPCTAGSSGSTKTWDGVHARQLHDLGGAAVVPGFHDAHQHLSERGQRARWLDLHHHPGVPTLETLPATPRSTPRSTSPSTPSSWPSGGTRARTCGTGSSTSRWPTTARWRGRSLLDAGMGLPGSGDAPVAHGAPLRGTHHMVNRRTGSRPRRPRCTPGFGLRRAPGTGQGTLRAGMLADLVVLSADPLAVPPDEIGAIEVRATVVGGEVAYEA